MIKLYNTLSGKVEEFKPLKEGHINIFVCGPTVYDYCHLGHAKTYIQFDSIVRSFRYLGYEVIYLQNITDIDNKIIKRAKERSVSPESLSREYQKYYLEDMAALNVSSVSKYARATDYIPQIIDQVNRLKEKGLAYKISDGYYFDISKFADYGKLSGRTSVKPGDAVSRIDENLEKKNPGDFCLWKFRKNDEPYWPSPIGEGRPGWHIEDTAITESIFGPQYDIHGGARDLIFPHHEAEIAQMESVSDVKPLVRYWMHTGFLNIEREKMSKSLGNFLTIRDLLAKGISPSTLRYYFLGVHYRSPIDFTWEALEAAENALKKLKNFLSSPGDDRKLSSPGDDKAKTLIFKNEFKNAIENDLNTPEVLAVVWRLVKDESISLSDKYPLLLDFDRVLGLKLDQNEFEIIEIPAQVKGLMEKRQKAREAKDWQKADELRQNIAKLGFNIKDTEHGQKLKKK